MQFDDDVPIPERTRRIAPSKYNLSAITVGQSFFCPSKNGTQCPALWAAANYKHRHRGWNYIARAVTEEGIEGVRIWCTALAKTEK